MCRPISAEDAPMAAIARAQGLPLATRNTADFERIEGLKATSPDRIRHSFCRKNWLCDTLTVA